MTRALVLMSRSDTLGPTKSILVVPHIVSEPGPEDLPEREE